MNEREDKNLTQFENVEYVNVRRRLTVLMQTDN